MLELERISEYVNQLRLRHKEKQRKQAKKNNKKRRKQVKAKEAVIMAASEAKKKKRKKGRMTCGIKRPDGIASNFLKHPEDKPVAGATRDGREKQRRRRNQRHTEPQARATTSPLAGRQQEFQ